MTRPKIQTRSISFTGSQGVPLSARLDYQENTAPDQYVIVSHCFTCTKQTLTTARLSRALAGAGMGVLRFDFSGLGESEGEFAASHFTSMVQDIVCAADFLAEYYHRPSVLIGHSMGGTASLAASQPASHSLASVKALVTLASPASPAHVLHHFGDALPQLKRGDDADIQVAGISYPVRPSFIEDVEAYDMAEQMKNCETPILAVTAGNDELVEAVAAQQILAYTRGAAHQVTIEAADHLFSDRRHAEQLADEVIRWIKR